MKAFVAYVNVITDTIPPSQAFVDTSWLKTSPEDASKQFGVAENAALATRPYTIF